MNAVTTPTDAASFAPLSSDDRADFERDGYLLLRGALNGVETTRARDAIADVYARRTDAHDEHGSMHLLSAVHSCPDVAFLLDHPATLGKVCSLLGWNLHVYHSHIDVHPGRRPGTPHWGWHQDGGRQNREIETDPRPRLSVKLAYWFTDLSECGRGNLMVVPGSHRANWLPGPPRRDLEWPLPEDAIEVCPEPGDALLFDRRLWHNRSINGSALTRFAAFFGYTYRWIVCRDEVSDADRASAWWAGLNPVQQQLLGGAGTEDGDDRWGHFPQRNALYRYLRDHDALDGSIPALIPDRAG